MVRVVILEITKLDKDDSYFIEFMYNYGKIEAIVKEKRDKRSITIYEFYFNFNII